MLSRGDSAPEFELQNQDGRAVKLSDYRGKRVVLFAFPKADTPGCTKQACGFRNELPKIEAADAVVLGISPDSPEALRKWKEKESLNYDLLADPEHRVLEALGAWGEKSMYGRKFLGVIRSHWIFSEDGTVLDAQIKVSPTVSVERATAFLAS
jgi:peroxiredoxin Q/BCP